MATVLLSPGDIIAPKTLPARQGATGSKTTVPNASKLGLAQLWHSDERMLDVARAYRHDTTPDVTPVYDCGDFDAADSADALHHGKTIPSSRYREQFTRRLRVLHEVTKADAAQCQAVAAAEAEQTRDDVNTYSDESCSDSDEDTDAAIGDSGSGNMLGIPLDRPPSLSQRTMDCGAAVALSLLSSVALESPQLIKEVLRNINKWLEHCVPCSLSPHAGYATMLTGGTVRRLLSFLLAAWQKGHPSAVKLAIQLALSRGELPLLVEVASGLVTQANVADPVSLPSPLNRRRSSLRLRPKGEVVMQELLHARDFLFSTYCPSRRLALPSFLRGEQRVAVGTGTVQGLAVAGGKTTILVAQKAGHKIGKGLLIQIVEGVDKRTGTPFVVDADAIPSVAAVCGGRYIVVAPSANATRDPANKDFVLLTVAVLDTKQGREGWHHLRIRLKHPHRMQERVLCKVVSCSESQSTSAQDMVVTVLVTSSVPVDEKAMHSAAFMLTSSQRRLVQELQNHPEWEATVQSVRSGNIPVDAAVDSLVEGVFRSDGADMNMNPQLPEHIATLLNGMMRHADRQEAEASDAAIASASVHWVSLASVAALTREVQQEEVDLSGAASAAAAAAGSPTTPNVASSSGSASNAFDERERSVSPPPITPPVQLRAPTLSPTPAPLQPAEPGLSAPASQSPSPGPSSPSQHRDVSATSQHPQVWLSPLRSVALRIPDTRTKRSRHRQSALSLTRNSLPEFAHPLPKIGKTQPCTLEAWVRGAVDSPATILCWGTPDFRVHLSIDRQKRHTLYFVGSTTKQQHRGVSASVPGADSHRWVHLCVTHDGAGGWSLYRNGQPIGEPHLKDAHDKPAEQEDHSHGMPAPSRGVRVPRTSSIPDMRSSDKVMHGSLGNAFVGCVAEARVWSECRTAEQVRTYLHTSLRGADLSHESSLLAYWPMDQCVGVVAFDHSAHRRHLLLQDGATWEDVPDMPVFRRTDANRNTWPVYMPSLRSLSLFVHDKELMLSVPKVSGGNSLIRVLSTYDANTGTLLREKLIPIGLPVLCQGVADGSGEGGSVAPLDGPLALDTTTGDIWALSLPTLLLASGTAGGSEAEIDDVRPEVEAVGEGWPQAAGKGILTMLGSLARRHTAAAPAVLSALYLSPVVSCLRQLCDLLALGCDEKDVELCKGAAGLLNACFSQNGWSSRAIERQQEMLEGLFSYARRIVDDNATTWTTPTLTATVEDLLRSGVAAGVFFPQTEHKVAQFQKLLHQGWGGEEKQLTRSERTVLDVLVNALADASAHHLLKGESIRQTLKQLLAAVRHPDAPPLLPLASALQKCVIGLASTGDEASEKRMCEYLEELFLISREEPHDNPIAISTLTPLLIGSLFLLHPRLTKHCDLVTQLTGLKETLIALAASQQNAPPVSLYEAASTFWHELPLSSSGSSLSCSTYEFSAATSVALTIDSTGDYNVVYWDPNGPGSLLHIAEHPPGSITEARPTRVTLETSRLVVSEVQVKDARRRRRSTNDRDSVRPVSGVLRAFGTEMAPRIGWLLDLVTAVFTITAQISCHAGIQPPNTSSSAEMEWVTSSLIFKGGVVTEPRNDICTDLLNGTEAGLRLWDELQTSLHEDRRQNGGACTATMLRAMLAGVVRLTYGYPAPSNPEALLPLLSTVELHRDGICSKLGEEGDDLVIDTFVKRCEFVVRKIRETGLVDPAKLKTVDPDPERRNLPEQHDGNVLFAASELLRLCTSSNVEVEELEVALESQKAFAMKRGDGIAMCASLLTETLSLPLENKPKCFIFLEVLRVTAACIAACGTHPLTSCQGCGPEASGKVQGAFFDVLKTALSVDSMIDRSQKAMLESLQMALLKFDWNASDLNALVDVGALRKLHENCSLPASPSAFAASPPMHLSPELWRGASTVGRGLLSLKLSADALGAAVYSPPGSESNGSAWVCDHPLDMGSSPSAAASETEVLHTVNPWRMDAPDPQAPRDATAGCEYFEVRVSSMQSAGTGGTPFLDRRNTLAVGLARAPPQEGGAPAHFVWWKSDGTFAAELGPDPPTLPEAAAAASNSRPILVGQVLGNTVGCGVLRGTNEVFFTRNGHLLGFHAAIPGGEWYPAVWLGSKAVLQCRFSPPFKFASRHPFLQPLSEEEVLNRRVRSSAWKAMASIALKAAKFEVTNSAVIDPITSLISSGIETVLTTPGSNKVKWIHARAALSVLVRVAAGKGVLKPLVIDGTTNALFRLACDADAPLMLRVQALGVLCPVVSQSSCNNWDDMIHSVLQVQAEEERRREREGDNRSGAGRDNIWASGVSRAACLLGMREPKLARPPAAGPELKGACMVRLLEGLLSNSSPFKNAGASALSVAASCLIRALLASPSWNATVSALMARHLTAFADTLRRNPAAFANAVDSEEGTRFFVAMRVMGALPSITECGMRVLVHSPGTAPTLATVTEWHPTLHNACVLADGVTREVAVSRLEPADGPIGGSCPLPAPETGGLLKAALDVTQAVYGALEATAVDVDAAAEAVENPLPHLKWLAEVACGKATGDGSRIGLLYTLPDVAERSGVCARKGVREVVPAATARWVMIPCLRLLEAYATHHPVVTRSALVEQESLLKNIAQAAYTPQRGWSPEVSLAPSRAHLEVLSVHQIQQLKKKDWGIPSVPTPSSGSTKPRRPLRSFLRIDPRLDFTHFTDRGAHSCDGCGHHPLQVDTEGQVGWYRCNTCQDYDLCGRCFRRGGIHVDHGHTFTDISQMAAHDPSPHGMEPSLSEGVERCDTPMPATPTSPPSSAPSGVSRTGLQMLLQAGGKTDLKWVNTLVSDMASGGSEIAALFSMFAEGTTGSPAPKSSASFPSGSSPVPPAPPPPPGYQAPPAVGVAAAPSTGSPHTLAAAMLPQSTSSSSSFVAEHFEQAEVVINANGLPAVRGTDGSYHCGAVVDGAQCRCGYCFMYWTNRCGPHKGCSCTGCQTLERRSPDCVVDMLGISQRVLTMPAAKLWLSLHEVSTSLCAISSRLIISILAQDEPESEAPPAAVGASADTAKPSTLAAKLPDLMDWQAEGWARAGDFLSGLMDVTPWQTLDTTSSCMAILHSIVQKGGSVALHSLMGRLLQMCCRPPPSTLHQAKQWKVVPAVPGQVATVRVASAPSMEPRPHNMLLTNQVVVEVEQCGMWLRHQYGWSPIEWNGVTLLQPLPSKQRPHSTNQMWIFSSQFDNGLKLFRPMLLDTLGDMARRGRWPLNLVLPEHCSSFSGGQKGVSVLAALVAAAHMHSKTRRRDALALVADLVQVYMKHADGGTPLAVIEGVEAMTPLLLHVLSAQDAPLSSGAGVWHAALELLVRLRRGLASVGASDLLDTLVKTPEARKARDALFALVEAFEDCVERVTADKPVPLPAVLTTPRRVEIPRAWTDTARSSQAVTQSRRAARRPTDSYPATSSSFLPPPVPAIDSTMINAYRWSRPSGVRENSHPVLSVQQWSAFAQLVSSTGSRNSSNVFKHSNEIVYRALRHIVSPSSDTSKTELPEVAGSINMPLPDLNIHEVQACRLTLQNITTLLLIPIVYFIDLTPHGIMHSELSKKFMAIKGLLMTQCKDGIVSTALKMTEVEPVVRPCLSFNRYPGANSDDTRVDVMTAAAAAAGAVVGGNSGKGPQPTAVHNTTLLPQLHSHLCDGKVQLACSSPAFVVKFLGEEGIDVGGLYKDLLSSICQELMSPASILLIPCGDCRYYVNPNCTSPDELALLGTLGRLMGSCLRTGEILGMDLHPLLWKKLVYEPCLPADHFDCDFFRTLTMAREASVGGVELTEDQFQDLCLVHAVQGQHDNARRSVLHDLIPGGRHIGVTKDTREEYARRATEFKLSEGNAQIQVLRQGILEVVPNIALALLSASELETRICGRPEIDVDELRKSARYHQSITESEANDLWAALRSFSRLDRQRFLRFVTGRPRMPLNSPLQIRIERSLPKYKKDSLPMSHTCFNTLNIPKYSDAATLRKQLLTAICHCDTTDMH